MGLVSPGESEYGGGCRCFDRWHSDSPSSTKEYRPKGSISKASRQFAMQCRSFYFFIFIFFVHLPVSVLDKGVHTLSSQATMLLQ